MCVYDLSTYVISAGMQDRRNVAVLWFYYVAKELGFGFGVAWTATCLLTLTQTLSGVDPWDGSHFPFFKQHSVFEWIEGEPWKHPFPVVCIRLALKYHTRQFEDWAQLIDAALLHNHCKSLDKLEVFILNIVDWSVRFECPFEILHAMVEDAGLDEKTVHSVESHIGRACANNLIPASVYRHNGRCALLAAVLYEQEKRVRRSPNTPSGVSDTAMLLSLVVCIPFPWNQHTPPFEDSLALLDSMRELARNKKKRMRVRDSLSPPYRNTTTDRTKTPNTDILAKKTRQSD